jgi:hypothetical protein
MAIGAHNILAKQGLLTEESKFSSYGLHGMI